MRKLFVTFAFVIFSLASFGVTFDLGIKGGYNVTKITSDLNSFKPDGQSGYNFGAFGRLGGEKIYLQPEFLYVVKKGGFSLNSSTDAIKMKSIQVPVLVGLKLLDFKVASVRAFTGPAISFQSGYDSDKSFTYNFNSSTLDYQLGAGVDLLMFTFDIRYEWGLSKTINTSNISSNFTSKGNTFTISLGFKFL